MNAGLGCPLDRRLLQCSYYRITTDRPTPWGGIYASTKAALHSLTDTLYMECTPLNISVLLVATGGVQSNLSANQTASFRGLPEDSLYKRYLGDIVGRIHMSQDPRAAMATDEYARRVAGKSLRRRPPRYMMLGGATLMYRALLWIPRTITLWLFWRAFTKISRRG